jgi:hypothetical protein
VPFVGYGSSEGRCLLCSGIYGRAVLVSPCSSHCVRYNHSQAQFGKMNVLSGLHTLCAKVLVVTGETQTFLGKTNRFHETGTGKMKRGAALKTLMNLIC